MIEFTDINRVELDLSVCQYNNEHLGGSITASVVHLAKC